MTDFRASMQRTQCRRRGMQILTVLRGRVLDIAFVSWPLLEASLRAELADVEAIARARGWVQ